MPIMTTEIPTNLHSKLFYFCISIIQRPFYANSVQYASSIQFWNLLIFNIRSKSKQTECSLWLNISDCFSDTHFYFLTMDEIGLVPPFRTIIATPDIIMQLATMACIVIRSLKISQPKITATIGTK